MTTLFAETIESVLNELETQAILEILIKIEISHWLEQNPFKHLAFVKKAYLNQTEVNGWYSYETRVCEVSTSRSKHEYTQNLNWGKTDKLSQTARTEQEAIQFTLLHETGHHIHAILQERNLLMYNLTLRATRTNAVSNYAKTPLRPREYFAETFVAWVLYRTELLVHDGLGYGIIERALKALALKVGEYDFGS